MNPLNDGGSAFPCDGQWGDGVPERGMTLRDWFAGQALAGELASTSTPESAGAIAEAAAKAGRAVEAQIALNCFKVADAMLAARLQKSGSESAINQEVKS